MKDAPPTRFWAKHPFWRAVFLNSPNQASSSHPQPQHLACPRMSLRRYSTWRRAMAKSVCIIGAGPSGLVAAKTLLHNAPKGEFKVTVFDAQDAIGGLWPSSKADSSRQVHPLMVANQSRHTMQFSDLAWEPHVPQLPPAWMVGQYLERYAAKYLSDHPELDLRLKSRVVSASQKNGGSGWDVVVEAPSGQESRQFDHLLVATGYFGKPIVPPGLSEKASIPVIHSSQYRDFTGLVSQTKETGGKILIVGGQMSGVEIAGTIASHFAAELNSPDDSSIPNLKKYSIHHVIQRPIWVFPLHTALEPMSKGSPFLPLDFSSYNRNTRPLPLTNTQGHITEDTAKMVHGKFQAALGTDQGCFSPLLKPTDEDLAKPPYLAVSDWYCDFVRFGLVELSNGKVESITGSTAQLSDGTSLDGVAAVVVAAGFDSSRCLDFLDADTLEKLNFSSKHKDQLVALAFHGTHHPEVSNLGFVGFYRSPYWGVMQMQARFLAQLWSSEANSEIFRQKLAKDESIQRTLSLRDDPHLSQFPMGDYAFLMQEFGEALSIPIQPPLPSEAPNLSWNNLPLDTLTPARYVVPNEDCQDNANAIKLLKDTLQTAQDGLTKPRFVPRAVFRSLLGNWRLERDLRSKLPTHPSGHFSGTAHFLLRAKTSDGLKCASNETSTPAASDEDGYEYLYIEDGEFKTEQGFGFRATRRYIYRYDDATEILSVWFAKPEDPKRADYLFHEIEFEAQPKEGGGHKNGWPAKSGHLCIDDYYDVKYNFAFKAVNLEEWTCAYTVKGPKKDYTISGTYFR